MQNIVSHPMYLSIRIAVVHFVEGGGCVQNPKNKNSRSYIRIGVRVSEKFCVWVESEPWEKYD